jgi:hypothetical protein
MLISIKSFVDWCLMLGNFFWRSAGQNELVDTKQKLPTVFKGQLPLATT